MSKNIRRLDIEQWMAGYIADLLGTAASDIDLDAPFDRFGLDSAAAVGMTGALEEWLGAAVDPALCYDYPTVRRFAEHLANGMSS